MMPLWLALPALACFAFAGAAVERASGQNPLVDRSLLSWTARVALGMAVFVAFAVHALAALAFVAGVVLHVRRLRSAGQLAKQSPSPMRPAHIALVGILVAVVAVRPPVPLVWDESVWLSKARIACSGPWALAARALDPSGGLVPAGYPIGTPALQAALAAFFSDLASLTGGAAALVLLAVVVFAVVLHDARDVFRPAAVLGILGAPLAWVHLRTGLLDLPLGLFAAAFALSLAQAARGEPRHALLAPALATIMAALKDEGALYVCTISIAMALASSDAPKVRVHAAVSVLLALLVAGGWRLRLALAGIDVEHRTVVGFAFDSIPALLGELTRAMTDVGSFGAALPVAIAAVVASLARSGRSTARALGIAWVLGLSGLLLGLVLGPSAGREFALGGTVFARALVQLLPLGALVLGAAIHERDARAASAITLLPSPKPTSTVESGT